MMAVTHHSSAFFDIVKSLETEKASSLDNIFKIVFNDDESVSLNAICTDKNEKINVRGLAVESYCGSYAFLTLPVDEDVMASKFELFVDKAHGSIRLFTAHGQYFVSVSGYLEEFCEFSESEVTEFFIEKI